MARGKHRKTEKVVVNVSPAEKAKFAALAERSGEALAEWGLRHLRAGAESDERGGCIKYAATD